MIPKICILLFLLPFGILRLNKLAGTQPGNSAPRVEIIRPLEEKGFTWNSIMPFSILVSDREDGNSIYDEIIDNEVFLEVEYLSDTSQLSNYLTPRKTVDLDILRSMSKSNCLNCHAARTKLIGPSFELIAQRYGGKQESMEMLIDKLVEGSEGEWGTEPMPAQPDLEVTRAKAMINWILNFSERANYTFYIGTEGSFRTKKKQEDSGVYILTASYQDHGIALAPGSRREGQHTVVLINK